MASTRFSFLSLFVLTTLSITSLPVSAQMTPDRLISKFDANGDGQISKDEFTGKRRPFKFFDKDGDGVATRAEIEEALGMKTTGSGGPKLDGQVPIDRIDPATRCGIGRSQNDCSIKVAIQKGLFPTGLEPRFPDGLDCHGIDEGWAISYASKRGREQYHGGIDMPAPYGTPMLAAADGTVVAKTAEPRSYRGIELIVRHSPEETGLPFWTYTQYAHFDRMPDVNVGDRVRMGQNLGPTGNSGYQRPDAKRARRPAIHFAVWFSNDPGFAVDFNDIIPVEGKWMDPSALYRNRGPYDSAALKALPDDEKDVDIPVVVEGGEIVPADTKLVWPYACSK